MSLSFDSVDIKKRIEGCKNLQEVEVIRLEYLGKKGLIPSEMKLLSKLPIDQKKIKGQELNKLKTFIEDAVNDHKNLIENKKLEEKLKNESVDITLPHNEELSKLVDLLKIDCTENIEIAEKEHINGYPTIKFHINNANIFFKGNRENILDLINFVKVNSE